VDVVMARLRGADGNNLRAVKSAAPEIYQLAAALMPPANGPMSVKQASLNMPPARPNTLGDLQRLGAQKANAARTLGDAVNGARIYRASYQANGSQSIRPAPALKDARSLFYAVHLGSYRTANRAFEGYAQIKAKTPGALSNLKPRVERVDLGPKKGIFERLKAGPFTSREEALSVCSQLRKSGQYCVPADFTGRTPG
jgi:SPOR domain